MLPRRVFALGGAVQGPVRISNVAKRIVGLRNVRVLPFISTLALMVALGGAVLQQAQGDVTALVATAIGFIARLGIMGT